MFQVLYCFLYGFHSFSEMEPHSLLASSVLFSRSYIAHLHHDVAVPSGAGCYSITSLEARIHARRSVCETGSSVRSAPKRGHTLIDF